ncbi:MAG: YcxB family protein [Bacilli bacterium]|nr:YcxB family protein [Bacilli bacterium]
MIINKSLYTIEGYKSFLKLLYKKVKLLSYITSFILFCIGILLMFFGFRGYVYIVFSLALICFVYFFINILESESIKKNALLISATQQIFTFHEDEFSLVQTSRIGQFEDKYSYSELFSAYKTKEYYFLFVNRTQAFIVDLNGFLEGKEEELDDLLKSKLGDRFINKGTKKNKD